MIFLIFLRIVQIAYIGNTVGKDTVKWDGKREVEWEVFLCCLSLSLSLFFFFFVVTQREKNVKRLGI